MHLHAQLHNGGTILKKTVLGQRLFHILRHRIQSTDYYNQGSIGNLSNKRNMSSFVYMQDLKFFTVVISLHFCPEVAAIQGLETRRTQQQQIGGYGCIFEIQRLSYMNSLPAGNSTLAIRHINTKPSI